eukprot:SAG31_NODE_495_length_14864_cov_21.943109_3_plen_940_part_00
MPSLEQSLIDESSLQDRDWFYAFNSLWDKKSTDRCMITIPDTVFINGGEPSRWAFTSKDGQLQYKKKANVKWGAIRDRFLHLQTLHNQRYNRKTSDNRPLDHGFVAVARSGGASNMEVKKLSREDFLNLFQTEGAELRSKMTILQAYVPIQSQNGTVYRNEFEQPRRNAFRLQTYKMVYMTGIEGTVVNEKGAEVAAELCQQALKCTAIALKDQLNAMTLEIVRYIEGHKGVHINALAAEYMVDEVDRRPFMTHITGLVTGAMPKISKPDSAKIVGPGSNMSKLLEISDAGSTMGDKKPEGDVYEVLDKKKKVHRRRKDEDEEQEEEDQMYLIPFKSVLLARLDEALAKDNESPRYKAVRQMAVTQELSKLNPAHFYRQVRVPEKHYRMYNLLDKQRQQNIEDAKQLVTANKLKSGRKSTEWWQSLNAQESGPGFDNSQQKTFAKLCRNLCQNHTLCEQLCQGSNGIKKDGPLPRILKSMVDSVVVESRIYAEDESDMQSEWGVEPSPPWILTTDKSRWRRSLTPTFSPSGYGGKTEHEVIAEAEAKLERARFKIEEEQRRRSRSVMDADSRSRRAASRSESLPDIETSTSSVGRRGPPMLHTGQRPVLPIVAASPAVTASHSASHNFPKKLPDSHELKARHELDTSTIEYREMYDPTIDKSVPQLQPAREQQQQYAGEDGTDGAVEDESALFSATNPVPGTYFRFAASCTIKYHIAETNNTGEGPPQYLVIFNDFFESYDKYSKILQPLLDKLPKGSQMLLFNYPGQAHTEFPADGVLNNVYLAEVMSKFFHELVKRGRFGGGASSDAKICPIAVGNGANIVSYWISQLQQTQGSGESTVGVEKAVLINPFLVTDAHLSLVLQNWLNTCDISQLFQFDLQLYFFSHLLFSEQYLQEKTPVSFILFAALRAYGCEANPLFVVNRLLPSSSTPPLLARIS